MSGPESATEAMRWLQYAYEDLRAAEAALDNSGFAVRHVCWLAQQSAEKAIKAALILLQIDFPWKHDLDVLRNLLPDDWKIKQAVPDLAVLTEWAVESRYPGEWPEATIADSWRAIEQARIIYSAISDDFSSRGFTAGKDT
jgi:HEPN domain-containing protein